jgi:hypothetical protein
MTDHEALAFAANVSAIAKKHGQVLSFVNNLALTLMHDGLPEDDMWDELEKYCIANRRNQRGNAA